MKLRIAGLLLLLALALILIGCEGASDPPVGSSRLSTADVYYVELSGNDSNSCESPAEACATIEGALEKVSDAADHFDQIYIGVGTFTAERVVVDKNVSFIGEGMGSTILQGNSDVGGALVSPDPVRVVFHDLTVTGAGAGISAAAALHFTDPLAELILRRVHLFANNTHGVEVSAPFHIQDSIFENNRGERVGGAGGGGLIERSKFLNNIGPAVYVGSGEVTILDSYFEGNQANFGSGIYSEGTTIVEGSTFTRNRLLVADPILTPSVIFQQRGSLSMLNVTMSGNPLAAAVIAAHAEVDISFSTFVANLHGVLLRLGITGRMENNLIGGNSLEDCYQNAGITFRDRGNIVATMNSGCSSPIDPIDIGVGPLQDNGGLTPTHALLEGSPAIDAADGCTALDQTGATRPIGLGCDSGAYEATGIASSFEGDLDGGEDGEFPQVTALQNASCRKGADAAFEVQDFLYEGETARIIGRIAAGTWFYVELPQSQERCWIFAEVLLLDGPIDSLPYLTSPELPSVDESDSGEEDQGGGGDTGGGGQSGGEQDQPDACEPPPQGCPVDQYYSYVSCSCQIFG